MAVSPHVNSTLHARLPFDLAAIGISLDRPVFSELVSEPFGGSLGNFWGSAVIIF